MRFSNKFFFLLSRLRLKTFYLLCLLFSCYNASSQFGSLELLLLSESKQPVSYNLYITSGKDTTHAALLRFDEFQSSFDYKKDSLYAGNYNLFIYSVEPSPQLITARRFAVERNYATRASFYLDYLPEFVLIDSINRQKLINEREAIEFGVTGFDNSFFDTKNPIKDHFGIQYTHFSWAHLSKHVGVMTGGELNGAIYNIRSDTSMLPQMKVNKVKEYYFSLNGSFVQKMRFTLRNQKYAVDHSIKFFFDIGYKYNLPIVFRHVIRYDDNKKFVNSRIHQFKDLRPFIAFGANEYQFYVDFRIFNYLIGHYAEVSKFNIGVVVNVDLMD